MNVAEPQPELRSTWSVPVFLAGLVIAFVQLALFTPALDGSDRNGARIVTQLAILGVLLARLLVARLRRERSRAWVAYVVCMCLAAPIWILVLEPFVVWLRR
jgi:hypothetical protein